MSLAKYHVCPRHWMTLTLMRNGSLQSQVYSIPCQLPGNCSSRSQETSLNPCTAPQPTWWHHTLDHNWDTALLLPQMQSPRPTEVSACKTLCQCHWHPLSFWITSWIGEHSREVDWTFPSPVGWMKDRRPGVRSWRKMCPQLARHSWWLHIRSSLFHWKPSMNVINGKFKQHYP